MWSKVLLGLTVAALPLAGTWADDNSDEAQRWLDRMTQAVQGLNYEGTFIYVHDQQMEAMHIIHQAGVDGEHERLVSLTGSPREVIRDPQGVTCILPDSSAVVVDKSRPRKPFPTRLPEETEHLTQNYEFHSMGEDRMAGRASRIIVIKPRDIYRYGYRYWVDHDSGMLLRSDLIDEEGMAVEQVMFTQLEVLNEVPSERLEPAIDSSGFTWHKDDDRHAPKEQIRSRWQVATLPAGFTLSFHKQHMMPMSGEPVEHLVFTDGLASVSVYIEGEEGEADKFSGTSRMGAVNAYGTVIDGHQITVVGEVPEATVSLIGESLRFTPEGEND